MSRVHLLRLAVGLWVALLAVVCITPLFKPRKATLFITYETAGEELAAGRRLYDVDHPDTDNYRYSPLVAAGFVPFTYLPLGVGGAVWRALGAAIYLVAMAAWARRACPDVPMAAVFVLALPLSIGSLNNGQANTHVLGLMLLASVLAFDGRWSLAAVAVAGAALFKGYPVALGGLLLLAAPLRFGPVMVLSVLAGLALPYAFQSPDYVSDQYRFWVENLDGDDRTRMELYAGYQDPQMLLKKCGMVVPKEPYRAVQAAAGLLHAGLAWWKYHLHRNRRLAAIDALTLGLCWMAVFGPGVETSTFILLAPVMARELLDPVGRSAWMKWAAVAGAVLFLVAIVALAFKHEVHRPVIATGIQPIAALLLCVAAVGRVVRRVPGGAPSGHDSASGVAPSLVQAV